MKLKKLASSLLFIGLAGAALTSQAEDWTFMPGMKAGYKAEPSLAITAGVMNANAAHDDAIGVYGLDYSMNCALLQTPDKRIRTHLQLNHADDSGVRATSLELQPRYTVPLGSGFSAGVGPAIAWVNAKTSAGEKDLFGYGVASGVEYRAGAYFSGVDLRYLNTDSRDGVGLENWTVALKLGVNF